MVTSQGPNRTLWIVGVANGMNRKQDILYGVLHIDGILEAPATLSARK